MTVTESKPPQYYDHTLTPLPVDATSLAEALQELRVAVRNGSEMIQANEPIPEKWNVGGMFLHFQGVALAFLRLDYQSSVLGDKGITSPDYRDFALQRIPSGFPDFPLLPSRLSPAGSFSPLTAVSLRIFSTLAKVDWKLDAKPSLPQEDITCLQDALTMALQNEPLVVHDDKKAGADDILYGRAGLLWLLINIRARRFSSETEDALAPIFAAIPSLVRVIIEAGRQSANEYMERHGPEGAQPLMYPWLEGHNFFGAVHGSTGILTVLLACQPKELKPYLVDIGSTITELCKLSNLQDGHLPMARPPFSYGQTSEFVQLCHGAPGLLILLAAALKNEHLTRDFWTPEWDETIYLASQRIWEEGLLSKGASLCHGISGNTWPWLLLYNTFEYHSTIRNGARRGYAERNGAPTSSSEDLNEKLTPDFFLSRALPFMLHSRETRPYNTVPPTSGKEYSMPDQPYSLFNGLAGNLCAWAETCAVIQAELRKMELSEKGDAFEDDSIFQKAIHSQLGFPLLGGNGAVGLL
ncbi:hypothetical protein N7532_010203 [Penicillium argentinense]|uniref:Lanthionine synthetase C family protein n=1 Tax=Penicillium argentinense TaxID=1131581 RepID=A0A9W9EP80_9EURO|nr:uncharacterized protein N7532_010203 [Penicillium argentinense]KAJ5085432.1 hypothetical protein N7532_010203 [Penicillium argentinense]